MTDTLPHETDPLDALLRAHAPPAVPDDGFTARTMQAIPNIPTARLDAARALVLEERRYAALTRRWRWGMAGIVAGSLLYGLAALLAPAGPDLDLSVALPTWGPLATLLAAGALWYAWSEFRRG